MIFIRIVSCILFFFINSTVYSQDSAKVYNMLGAEKLKNKQYEEAIILFTKAIKINMDYSYVWYNRGIANFMLKSYDDAMSDFSQAIKINTEYSYAYQRRGVIYGLKGDYTSALNDLNMAVKFGNFLGGAYMDRGYIKYLTKDYRGALNDYDTCIVRLETQFFQGELDRFKVYYYKGLAEEARDSNVQALNNYYTSLRYKKDENTYNSIGLLKIKMHKAQAAILDFDKAIALNSTNAEFYYNRAIAKKTVEDKTACDDFKMAHKLGYTKALSAIQNDCKNR